MEINSMFHVHVSSVSIKDDRLIIGGDDKTETLELSLFSAMSPISKMEESNSLYQVVLSFRMRILRGMKVVVVYGEKTAIESFVDNFNKALK